MMFLALIHIAAAALAPAAAEPSNTPEGRAALAEFAGCIVKSSPDKVHSALTRDFRSRDYRRELKTLSEINRDCLDGWEGLQRSRRVQLRAGGLPFAAALAEAMMKRDNAPLNARLLRAAKIEAPTYAPSDRVAMCIARSDADHVAALLNSSIASEDEAKAAEELNPALRACSQGTSVVLEPYGLRAILATASYRLLAAGEVTG
jgi:hypothetical protein